MAIPTDHQMIWTEIYQGYFPVSGKLLDFGWCCLPKGTPAAKAVRCVDNHFHSHDYAGKIVCVMAYPEERCAFKFKASDRVLCILG